MKNKLLALSAILLLLSTASVSAQNKWKYDFSIGGTYNSGNISNIGLRNTGRIDAGRTLARDRKCAACPLPAAHGQDHGLRPDLLKAFPRYARNDLVRRYIQDRTAGLARDPQFLGFTDKTRRIFGA